MWLSYACIPFLTHLYVYLSWHDALMLVACDNRRVPTTAADGDEACLGATTTGVSTKLASAIIYNQRQRHPQEHRSKTIVPVQH
jgi:hypothetical protein